MFMPAFNGVRYSRLSGCLVLAALTAACGNQTETPEKPRVFTSLCELVTAEMVQSAFNQPVNQQTAEPDDCTYSGIGNSAAFITLTTTLLTAASVTEAREFSRQMSNYPAV